MASPPLRPVRYSLLSSTQGKYTTLEGPVQNVALTVLGLLAVATICVFLVVVGGAIYLLWRERHDLTADHQLAARQDRLESKLQQLRDEWESARSNLDTIVRRGIRLNVLAGKGNPDHGFERSAEPPAPMTRAELLKRALSRGTTQKEKKEVNE